MPKMTITLLKTVIAAGCSPTMSRADPISPRGYNSQPQHIAYRALRVKELPNEPLDLFLHFIPYSLVERWVQYTNSWIAGFLHERPLRPQVRLRRWGLTTVPELYIWLAILLYIGTFKESKVEDIWKTSNSGH